jgi:hypothetical protein
MAIDDRPCVRGHPPSIIGHQFMAGKKYNDKRIHNQR